MTDRCTHVSSTAVWTEVGTNGEPITIRQLRFQCNTCGALARGSLPHRIATAETPNVDVAAVKRACEEEQKFWEQRSAAAQAEYRAKREAKYAEWLAQHTEYLQTPEWWARRDAVMARANGICEGCLSAPAVHMHHVTYEHWRNELLWELVAVCVDCQRCHPDKQWD
jgi:hypothetical protein